MARRYCARRSAWAGAEGAGARPAAASVSTPRRRSTNAASEAAPMTSAPRSGALQTGVAEEDAEAEAGCWLIIGISEDFWGRLLTATERFPFPFSRWGMYSSNTAWKLVPPKPKALKPARRTPAAGISQGFNSVFT